MQRVNVAKLKDSQNVWLVERRREFCFLFEALHSSFVKGDIRGQDLKCHNAIELRVLGKVDFTHSACPKLANDSVVTYPLFFLCDP